MKTLLDFNFPFIEIFHLSNDNNLKRFIFEFEKADKRDVNLGLVIQIRMKNRQTGKFSKNRFLIGHNSSGKNRNLRPKISRI